MSITVLRLGLWTLILSLGLYVVDTTFEGSKISELITVDLVQDVFMLSIGLVVLGFILRVFDKTAGKVLHKQTRCRMCDVVIPNGQIYCRAHLRGMLEREDRKTHNTRIR